MAVFLAPIINDQQEDANGNPLTGGLIEVYLAGTSTPSTTYSDKAGLVPNSWPIVLNTLGINQQGAVWITGGSAYKFVIKNSSGVVQRTIDNIGGINDSTFVVDQWVVYQGTPTYISATSFSVPGDQTQTFQPYRRIKSANTGGTITSTITNSVYSSPNTTVTVTNDSGVLDSGLSQVWYGVISAQATSLPSLPRRQRATANGSMTVPDGVITMCVSACGGGGGGGSGATGNTAANGSGGGGGGGGAWIDRLIYSVVPGSTISWTIGAAGTGGPSNTGAGVPGTAGGATVITGLVGGTITLNGGDGGGGGNVGAIGSFANGGSGGAGGSGGSTLSSIGGDGGDASDNPTANGGIGGSTPFGIGGFGGRASFNGVPSSRPASGYGGGGGGGGGIYNSSSPSALPSAVGSAGAPGFVLLEW